MGDADWTSLRLSSVCICSAVELRSLRARFSGSKSDRRFEVNKHCMEVTNMWDRYEKLDGTTRKTEMRRIFMKTKVVIIS